MELIYQDRDIVVCVKPPRVLSTDEPGGVPELVREALGTPKAKIRTVHRLDQVVSGLMVLARRAKAASELSRQIREGEFEKEYLAVICGRPEAETETLRDLLFYDRGQGKSYAVKRMRKGVKEAVLDYTVLDSRSSRSLLRVRLHTGRTHQIRVQFASRGMPLAGDRRYGAPADTEHLALYCHRLSVAHPNGRDRLDFTSMPDLTAGSAWEIFADCIAIFDTKTEE